MNKKWLLITTMGLALLLSIPLLTGCGRSAAALSASSPAQNSLQAQGIWVTATGEVLVTPDIATLSLGVSVLDTNVAQAQSQASDAMAKVLKALADSGIAQKDIQTGYFNISQRTRWDESRQTESIMSYQVTNTVKARIRDVDNTGNIIDAAVQAGGNFIRINGISFSVENPALYYQDARSQAMAVAKSKADELAKLAGVSIGKPAYIAENAQYTPYYGGYANFSSSVPAPMVDTASSAPISAGETKITLSIQVNYSIVQ